MRCEFGFRRLGLCDRSATVIVIEYDSNVRVGFVDKGVEVLTRDPGTEASQGTGNHANTGNCIVNMSTRI